MEMNETSFARSVAMKVKSEKVAEYIELMKNNLFPRTSQCEGIRRLYL